jgi:hypothetical protein
MKLLRILRDLNDPNKLILIFDREPSDEELLQVQRKVEEELEEPK